MITDPKIIAEQLMELALVLNHNKGKIIDCLEKIQDNDPNSHVNLFAKYGEYQHRLEINLMVRTRLLERWNKLIKTKIR